MENGNIRITEFQLVCKYTLHSDLTCLWS